MQNNLDLMPPIFAETLIHSDSKNIYEAISTAAGWDAWFTTGTDFVLKKGHVFNFIWKNWGPRSVNTEAKACIENFEQDKLLRFYWNYSLINGPTLVEIRLIPKEQAR